MFSTSFSHLRTPTPTLHSRSTIFVSIIIVMGKYPYRTPIQYGQPYIPVGLQFVPPSRGGPAARIASTQNGITDKGSEHATIPESPSSVHPDDRRAVHEPTGRIGREGTNQTRRGNATHSILSDDTTSKFHKIAGVGTDGATDNEFSKEETHDQSLHEDDETPEDFGARFTDVIQKMMFVSGETAEPSQETTTLIEEIVRQQVVEMVCSTIQVIVLLFPELTVISLPEALL